MGTSKRYADSIDRRMGVQADQSIMRGGTPESLTATELELKTEPLTRTPQPMPVTAWVRYGRIGIRVNGRAWRGRPRPWRWSGMLLTGRTVLGCGLPRSSGETSHRRGSPRSAPHLPRRQRLQFEAAWGHLINR